MSVPELVPRRSRNKRTPLAPQRRQDLEGTLHPGVERAAELANTSHGYLFHLEAPGEQTVTTSGVGFFERRFGDRIVPEQSIAGLA